MHNRKLEYGSSGIWFYDDGITVGQLQYLPIMDAELILDYQRAAQSWRDTGSLLKILQLPSGTTFYFEDGRHVNP